jgi:hypothetical protein
MAAVLFVELPSANTKAAAGNRGGFFMRNQRRIMRSSGKTSHPDGPVRLAPCCPLR